MSLAFFQTQLRRFRFWPVKAECSHRGCSTCWGIGMSCSLQISMKQFRRKMKPLRSQRNHHPHWPKRNTRGPCRAKKLKTASKLLWCCPSNSGFPEFESITMFIDNVFFARKIACMCIASVVRHTSCQVYRHTSQVDFWSWDSFKPGQVLFSSWGFLFVNTSPIPLLTLSLWHYDGMTWYDIAAFASW